MFSIIDEAVENQEKKVNGNLFQTGMENSFKINHLLLWVSLSFL